jgi:hypothetical protein
MRPRRPVQGPTLRVLQSLPWVISPQEKRRFPDFRGPPALASLVSMRRDPFGRRLAALLLLMVATISPVGAVSGACPHASDESEVSHAAAHHVQGHDAAALADAGHAHHTGDDTHCPMAEGDECGMYVPLPVPAAAAPSSGPLATHLLPAPTTSRLSIDRDPLFRPPRG